MQKYRFFLLMACIFMGAIVISCKSTDSNSLHKWIAPNGKVKVLCTTAMVSDIVKGVGGDLIDSLTLIQGESDPHSYQLVKGDDEKFSRADIIFYSGLGLEHSPSLRTVLEGNGKAHALGDYLQKIAPNKIIFVDKTVDPHIWMDVDLWRKTALLVYEELAKKIPDQKAALHQNAKNIMDSLKVIDNEIATRLGDIPESLRYLVTTHDAFNYFTKAYLAPKKEASSDLWRLRCQAPEGLAPDSQLSTADIQQLVDHLSRFKIMTIFAESNISRDSLKKIIDVMASRGQKVRISPQPLYADAMGSEDSGSNTYASMMQHDSRVIAEELQHGS